MIGYTKFDELARLCLPLSDAEKEAYDASTEGAPKVTARKLRIDFEQRWSTHTGGYNGEVRSFVINHLLNALRGGSYARDQIPRNLWDEDVIGAMLDAHMKYLKDQYKISRLPENEKAAKKSKKLVAAAKNSRKRTVHL